MGAACGCMEAKSKGGGKNHNIQSNKGGVMIGGTDSVDDVAAARAAKFGQKREEANNRGVSKEK